MKFARWTFGVAGVYGVLVILPLYFLEGRIAQDTPPAITHPEFYYGFVGLGLAWQLAFLGIATDPARYRLMMLPSVVEKFSFAIAVAVLYCQDRVAPRMLAAAAGDLLLGILFIIAYRTTAGSHTGVQPTSGEPTARVGLQSLVRLTSLQDVEAEIERLQVAKENAVAKADFQQGAWLRDRGDDLKKMKQAWPQGG
jgi:hypothetical protein